LLLASRSITFCFRSREAVSAWMTQLIKSDHKIFTPILSHFARTWAWWFSAYLAFIAVVFLSNDPEDYISLLKAFFWTTSVILVVSIVVMKTPQVVRRVLKY